MDDKAKYLAEWMKQVQGPASSADLEAAGQLAPKSFKTFADTADFFYLEATNASKGGAMLAACIMSGAAVEAALLVLAFLYQDEVFSSDIFKNRKFRRSDICVSQLQFAELIELSRKFSWIPSELIAERIKQLMRVHEGILVALLYGDTTSRYLPSDPAQAILRFLNTMRNSVHAGRFVQMNRKPDDLSVNQACHVAYLLSNEMLQSIAVTMKREGSRITKFMAPQS